MKFRIKPAAIAVSAAVTLLPLMAGPASAATYAPWLVQMGVSESVASAANWGKNQMLGVVDSGIVANHPAFATGQVSTALSACAAISFTCKNGFVDDNAHGTAVAEIAAGNKPFAYNSSYGGYVVTANSIISMAPNANILVDKAIAASGSGMTYDVANGIRKAADAGAAVINVSISYLNSGDLIGAINYAAGKGAFIVWAGGNSAQALLGGTSSYGFTQAAIQRLIFVGSVNSASTLSSFSNKPGSGSLVDTSAVATGYAARWVMTPGDGILAPIATSGTSAWGYWKGTSMSAPLASGSLILLQSAWPILKTKGTAANLLLATATDLGTKGVDQVYGNGLVNLATAFQPYGALTVTNRDGLTVPVSSLTTAMISGGALGSMTSVYTKLAGYTAFDGYARNFSVDLSGLLKTPTTAAKLNPLPSNANSGPTAIKLRDGAEFAYMQAEPANPAAALGVFGLNPDLPQDKRIGYAMLTDKAGATTAIGYGYPVQFAYAKALYGNDDIATLASQSGAASLAGLAQGGGLFAYGMKLGEDTRVALSWSGTAAVIDGSSASWNPAWSNAKASNVTFGVSRRIADRLSGGVNVGFLSENHGMLGSVYDANALLSLGAGNRSTSLGLSMSVDVARDSSLLFEAGFAKTEDASGAGLLAGTRDVRARSYGMTFMSRHLLRDDDRLTLAVVQPLRVVSGQVAMVMPHVDADGIASYGREWLSLVPGGREVDYKLAYETPLRGRYALPIAGSQSLSLQAGVRKDVLNVAGSRDASAGVAWNLKF